MGNEFSGSYEHLLENDKDASPDDGFLTRKKTPWLRRNYLLLLNFILFVYVAGVVTFNMVKFLSPTGVCKAKDVHYRLPEESITYEERPEWDEPMHPWNLRPSQALDDAWNDLLYAVNIRITPEEMALQGHNVTNRIEVNGGDYWGIMGIHHHLHCLDTLRKVIHWDYYESRVHKHPGLEKRGYDKDHSDHCIDAMRQALMCHANTEVHSGVWTYDPNVPNHVKLASRAMTTCVKWDSVDAWARKRALLPGHFTFRPVPFDRVA